MANWQGLILTKKGQALMAKVEAGATLDLTKLKLGSGVLPEGQNLEELTDLITPEQNLGIAAKEAMMDEEGNYTGLCKISSTISNAELAIGYYVRELGVFANDPDDGEILYAITTDTAPDYLPAAGGATVISQEFAVYVAISNAENITAKIDPGALATMGYVQLAIKTHNEDDTAHADFTGAKNNQDGKRGFVPKPKAGEGEYFLAGKGAWVPQPSVFIPLVKRNTAYSVDQIATGENLPAGTFLRCITAGTTDAAAPAFSPSATAGTTYTDGGVTWVVDSYLPASENIVRSVDGINADAAGDVALNTMTYKRLSSIDYVEGCFWADSNSGIEVTQMPAGFDDTDWAMWQIGMLNGDDRTQFAVNGTTLYCRASDNSQTSAWSEWEKIITENSTASNWSISKGTKGWVRNNNNGFTIQWGRVAANGDHTFTYPRSFTTFLGGVACKLNTNGSTWRAENTCTINNPGKKSCLVAANDSHADKYVQVIVWGIS